MIIFICSNTNGVFLNFQLVIQFQKLLVQFAVQTHQNKFVSLKALVYSILTTSCTLTAVEANKLPFAWDNGEISQRKL